MISRRRMFGLLAAGPLAAKRAADAAVAKLAGIDISGAIPPGSVPQMSMGDGPLTSEESVSYGQRLMNFWAKNSVPEWGRERLWKRAKHVTYLDPDLAQNCWSMAAKIHEQRKRNLRRLEEHMRDDARWTRLGEQFRDAFGVYPPW